MNRRFALSALTLLLTACGQIESAPHLSDRTIDLGTRLSAEVRVPLQGRWEISRVPDWLDVSGRSGTGDIALTVTAHRPNATQPPPTSRSSGASSKLARPARTARCRARPAGP